MFHQNEVPPRGKRKQHTPSTMEIDSHTQRSSNHGSLEVIHQQSGRKVIDRRTYCVERSPCVRQSENFPRYDSGTNHTVIPHCFSHNRSFGRRHVLSSKQVYCCQCWCWLGDFTGASPNIAWQNRWLDFNVLFWATNGDIEAAIFFEEKTFKKMEIFKSIFRFGFCAKRSLRRTAENEQDVILCPLLFVRGL